MIILKHSILILVFKHQKCSDTISIKNRHKYQFQTYRDLVLAAVPFKGLFSINSVKFYTFNGLEGMSVSKISEIR